MALLVLVQGEDGMSSTVVDSDDILVGSGGLGHVDLHLDGEGIGPRHLRVRADNGAITVQDGTGVRTVAALESVAVGRFALRFKRVPGTFAPRPPKEAVEQQLLDAIAAQPGDAGVREVYADWLEAAGRPSEAEFLRIQLALADARDATDPQFSAAAKRLGELAADLPPSWRSRVAIAFIEGCPAVVPDAPASPATRRLAMRVVCPQRWDKLAPTDDPAVRTCGACQRSVHYCTSIDRAREHAAAGRCVAVDVRNSPVRRPRDLDAPLRARSDSRAPTVPRADEMMLGEIDYEE
jgi:uncharacterized protein (TIGR02996 family)